MAGVAVVTEAPDFRPAIFPCLVVHPSATTDEIRRAREIGNRLPGPRIVRVVEDPNCPPGKAYRLDDPPAHLPTARVTGPGS